MLEFFFIERGRGLLRTITRSLWAPVITNKRKKQQTNKPADQRPIPVLFLLQLLLLAELACFYFKEKPDRRLIGD